MEAADGKEPDLAHHLRHEVIRQVVMERCYRPGRSHPEENLAALDVLAPDGVLAACSCSGSVGRELFVDLIGQVAEQSGRPIQILEQRGQAPDHPVSASCLETEYLKYLICRVE
jgi:23S rRNA G2069 N7-methylase RlmK/C1962 C5-methylase RlmI